MIKIPKKPLFSLKNPLLTLNNFSPLGLLLQLFLFFFFLVFLPFLLSSTPLVFTPALLVFYYLANLAVAFFLFNGYTNKKYRLQLEIQDEEEEINVLKDQAAQGRNIHLALEKKIDRYARLKDIMEKVGRNLNLDSVADTLVDIAFSLISAGQGNCILYLVDDELQSPLLFKARKENLREVIKAKQGDIFDLWVLRHSNPLLIEDIKNDFRFDQESFKNQDDRQVYSLISAPLKTENRQLGILRLDHPEPRRFTQDDLRFLVSLCDLAAIAIDNAKLFNRTQELAIHDSLTDLYTKSYFLDRLRQEYKRALRTRSGLSCLMLDIDHFKKYNDKYGHSAGDIVLRSIAEQMKEFFKEQQAEIGRFGGEEFCIVLAEVDKKHAVQLAEAFCKRIARNKIMLRRQDTAITVSIGVAALFVDAADEGELIFNADQALLAAKSSGRNKVVAFSSKPR